MGWSCYLKADKNIKESDVDAIVAGLPDELQALRPGFTLPGATQLFQPSKQAWGWSCATDISKPKGREICISGAHFSYEHAEDMRVALKKGLKEKGYKVRSTKVDY